MPVRIEELIELLVVHPVRPFNLAVEVRGPRTDVEVPHVLRLEVPVELGLEFGAIVGLHDVDPKRQAAEHIVDEDHWTITAKAEPSRWAVRSTYLTDVGLESWDTAPSVIDGKSMYPAGPGE
jgi:hypothetical protein